MTYDFTFKEKSVDIIIINSGKKKKINYSYLDFKKIYEYDDLFEIRLQSKEVLLCLKDGFENDKEKMMDWAKAEAAKETALYNQQREQISVRFSQTARIPLEEERLFNIGYLFLQQLCSELRLTNICKLI